jgi:hypothetical protein
LRHAPHAGEMGDHVRRVQTLKQFRALLKLDMDVVR